MAKFEIAHKLTQNFEGGFANNPNDSGGMTWRGIARNYNPKWKGWIIVDSILSTKPKDINSALYGCKLINDLVDEFYEVNYWDSINLDLISSQEVANLLFDSSVNMGVGRAVKFLQQSLYPAIVIDGKIGPKTIAAANAIDSKKLYDLILKLRKAKYDEIIAKNPSQIEFKKSWYSRLVPFEKANPTV